MTDTPVLRVDEDLSARHYGVPPGVALGLSEAVRVCLARHHQSPAGFDIQRSGATQAIVLEWLAPNDRLRAGHANETDATEAGACACVLAAVDLTMELVAIHRAETRTGADYYVAPLGVPVDDLEQAFRLEISGVDRGSAVVVRQRLAVKLEQAVRGASNLPALAGVVGFRARLIMIEQVAVP